MNQNILLIALVVGALFFLRRPTRANQGWNPSGQSTYIGTVPGVTGVPGIPGTTGMYGEG
jgi:hypothetical protein